MQALEEQIAHLTRTVEELSDVVAGQQDEISRLSTRVRMLMEREAGREQAGGGAHVFGGRAPATLLTFQGWGRVATTAPRLAIPSQYGPQYSPPSKARLAGRL